MHRIRYALAPLVALALVGVAGPTAAQAAPRAPGVAVGLGTGSSDQLLDATLRTGGTVESVRRYPGSAVFNYFGGGIAHAPAILNVGTATEDVSWVFGTAPNGAVYYRRGLWPYGAGQAGTDRYWSAWTSLGGGTARAPSATCTQQGTAPWVFVRGGDGALWQRQVGGAWSSLGGALSSAPSAAPPIGGVCPSATKDVAALGTDGAVWEWRDGVWGKVGGASAHAPALLTWAGVSYVFVVGGNGALYLATRTGSGAWSAFTKLGGEFTTGPAAQVRSNGAVPRLFVVAEAADGRLWSAAKPVSGGSWSFSTFAN